MLNKTNNISYLIAAALFSALIIFACSETLTDNKIANEPPDTKLFIFPDSSISKQQSRLRIHWWGDDPDGLVIGYYYSWDGINWSFTDKNEILFTLQIGASDTSYIFHVAAVDNSGNGKYDQSVFQNGLNFGTEPFIDANSNGLYDSGEKYFDIGLIDPTPAMQEFPIKNSPPSIKWNDLSAVPDTSYPVMTFAWSASDIDGDESIISINIALNDTTNFVTIDGSIRLITIRTKQFDTDNPLMDIYINGQPNFTADVKLPGLLFNSNNKFFIRSVDVSGAASKFISLPADDKNWFVKKPRGKILVIDDYVTADQSAQFYREKFDSLQGSALKNNYDVWDLKRNPSPYAATTFLETIKLYNALFWYSDNSPTLDLASTSIQTYLNSGGKVFFSMLLPRTIDLEQMQSFLPVDSFDQLFITSVVAGADIVPDSALSHYPSLKTTDPVFIVRTFYPSQTSASTLYYINSSQVTGNNIVGLRNNDNNLYFLAMPLNKSNAMGGTVVELLNRIFFEEFNINL